MGQRGPQPTPTAILSARGSWRAKKRSGEPKPAVRRPRKPKHLADPAGKIFNEVSIVVEKLGVVSTADAIALEVLAVTLARWRALVPLLDRHGEFYAIDGKTGNKIFLPTPPAAAIAGIQKQLVTLLDRFGLSPAARARLVTGNAVARDEDEQAILQLMRDPRGRKKSAG